MDPMGIDSAGDGVFTSKPVRFGKVWGEGTVKVGHNSMHPLRSTKVDESPP